MALIETVEYPQDPFGYAGIFDTIMDHSSNIVGVNWDSSSSSVRQNVMECWECPNSSPEACTGDQFFGGEGLPVEAPSTEEVRRQKRRRTKSSKNKEELESQRMTHIVVERNRRKQMNEYLAAVRSLMPASYVQRGDQASIIGGAINFVKELEHLLQTLQGNKRTTLQQQHPPNNNGLFSPSLFADFFAFPQYSTSSSNNCVNSSSPTATDRLRPVAFGDIEVTMVESHANLKVLSKRRPRQLLKLAAGLQCLRLSVLHLNVTTADQMVLYSLSVKIEDGCRLTTADEIADAVNQLLGSVEEEAAFV